MNRDCTVYETADFIGKRWTLLILLELYKGKSKKRYSEIKKDLKEITPKILSARLKELEKKDLIKKEIDTSSIPMKCYYSLNKSGTDFIKIIQQIKSWALKWKIDNRLCQLSECKNCEL
ncbi:transcriptional regulator [archaeon]|nr:transcriptional regulator [archaeon]|tara:strand:- start:3595 stop:3951 length:357 start_codon:yes stop_codon:yes gene_type:complete